MMQDNLDSMNFTLQNAATQHKTPLQVNFKNPPVDTKKPTMCVHSARSWWVKKNGNQKRN